MVDGRDLPLFDADLESQKKPSSVEALIDHVNQAGRLDFLSRPNSTMESRVR